MRLATARLDVRPVEPSDRDELHRLELDPDVMRFLNGGQPTPLAPIDPDSSPYRMPRGRETDVWAVIVRDSGAFVGWVALHIEHGSGELGYRFRREAWGYGYATEASRALIAAAFGDIGVRRVFARTMAANARSRRVMERLACGLSRRDCPTAALPKMLTSSMPFSATASATDLATIELRSIYEKTRPGQQIAASRGG